MEDKMKICTKCSRLRPLVLFGFQNSRKYYRSACNQCEQAYRESKKNDIRFMATRFWNGITQRAEDRDGRHPTYHNVKNLMTRNAFIQWATSELASWLPKNTGKRPTIDRIRGDGHYEFGNMQVLSKRDNSIKQDRYVNVIAPEGTAWCSLCKSYIDRSLFYPCKSKHNGLRCICKACMAKRDNKTSRKNHSMKKKRQAELLRETGLTVPQISKIVELPKHVIYWHLAKLKH